MKQMPRSLNRNNENTVVIRVGHENHTDASSTIPSHYSPDHTPRKKSVTHDFDTPPPTLEEIPILVDIMLHEPVNSEDSLNAIHKLFTLTTLENKHNRIPMVSSGKYDVLAPLCQYLIRGSPDDGDGRHFVCMTLNNLSIPNPNKKIMVLGPTAQSVLGALCKVISEDKEEAYLCCICLLNLSLLEDTMDVVLQYSPGRMKFLPLQNPKSLIRILENILNTYSPTTPNDLEGIRWATGLLKNLSTSKENARLISQTDIPSRITETLRQVTTPSERWGNNSLEEFSLLCILNLAQWASAKRILIRVGALDVLKDTLPEHEYKKLNIHFP